ncbi:hypothetical protein Glove_139g196 [Diversispora epigaea]|uniref:Uncharacterized protein n=1 Tax=Diversispora epigaea TaxID=1348612 RepID=A0A397IVW5_9GLOM|nr:hypothetical protein Glove_139g196 [Diversispora epigaea]
MLMTKTTKINEKNEEKAFELYLKFSKEGLLRAIISGKGAGWVKTRKKILKAAEKGSIEQQHNLEYFYENGYGIDEN